MESGVESPRRGKGRLLGAILIGLGVLALLAMIAVPVVTGLRPGPARAARAVPQALSVQVERARPHVFWLGPAVAGLFRFGLTVATFGLLAIGAFLLVREISRSQRQPAGSAPLTGPEADRARE